MSSLIPRDNSGWTFRIAIATGAACLAVALVPAIRAASGLTMPYDMDHFREVASAQVIADGRWGEDPYYRGETTWYNPLLAATVAAISTTSGLATPAAYVQSGPFLNGLAQLAFFVMALRLVGPWPAVLALAALLFSPPHDRGVWETPTVSPWLFPSAFASGLFYAGLLACRSAIARPTVMRWLAGGALLGVTFLGHTAPAVLLGLCSLVAVALAGRSANATRREQWLAYGAVFGAALVASAPFLTSIVGHYHLTIANGDPLDWVSDGLALSHGAPQLWEDVLSVKMILAVVGGWALWQRARVDPDATLVATWAVAATLLFVYGYAQQLAGFGRLPRLVPQHHFYFYLTAARHVLTGLGAWVLIEGLAAASARRAWPRAHVRWQSTLAGATALAGVLALVGTNYGSYAAKPDFDEYRREALAFGEEFERTALLTRLRAETPPDAVILANATDSFYRVAPAGRAVVAVPSIQSNPYRNQGARDNAQEAMVTAFLTRDGATFERLTDAYAVTHVVMGPEEHKTIAADWYPLPGIREVSSRGGYTLYERVREPSR